MILIPGSGVVRPGRRCAGCGPLTWLGPNAPAGMKTVFVLNGTTVDPDRDNSGILTSGAAVNVDTTKWNVSGGAISAGGNRIESVPHASAICGGRVLRKHLYDGDTGFQGFLSAQTAWRNWTPPAWSGPVGLQRTYYQRMRYWGSANWYDGEAWKVGGYLGSAARKNSYVVSQQLADGTDYARFIWGSQDDCDAVTTFSTGYIPTQNSFTTVRDIEVLLTVESSGGAADGSVYVWINNTLATSLTGRSFDYRGLEGGQFPCHYNGTVAGLGEGVSMYTDWDIFGIAAVEV